MSKAQRRSGRGSLVVVIPVLLLLLPFGYSLVSALVARKGAAPEAFLERPDPRYESCVKETDYMRFHHWELLRGIREEVVRYGKRGELGLKKCRQCHTSRERFCNRCHEAVSLYPDCFDCHYYP